MIRESLILESFINAHKISKKAFTRKRKLPFEAIFMMSLRKGMKSLQNSLNELIPKFNSDTYNSETNTVTNMAYIKARKKLRHTAFTALNQMAVVGTMYSDDDYKTFAGLRILAIDGSKIQLPDEDKLKEAFGVMPYKIKTEDKDISGEHVFALGSVLYDVMNRVALHPLLLPCKTYEVTAARAHLAAVSLTPKDLIVYDRGYHSFLTMAATVQAGAHFLIRCKRGSGMKVVDEMLDGKGSDDRTETIAMTKEMAKDLALEDTTPKALMVGSGLEDQKIASGSSLPKEMKVRFTRIVLKNGGIEVLATSVLDSNVLTVADLAKLYYLRWGIETFYGVVKTRLVLENFTGYSEEAIRQDFFSTVLLCGIESICILEAEETLKKQTGGHQKKVNKAMSFNAIKNNAFELFLSDKPIDETMELLTSMFLTSPTIVRPDRNPPRINNGNTKILGFWKRFRKSVF